MSDHALIIANLDAETSWARRAGHRVKAVPKHVLERISLYGTLLRAIWPSASRLWTPAPVDERCVRDVPGLPPVELVSSVPDPREAADAAAWASAPPWNGPAEQMDAAMRVNDRRFAVDLVARLGLNPTGAVVLDTLAGVESRAREEPHWVLKTPFGTAGRGFIHGRGDAFDRGRIARLLEAHGALVFERWVERAHDIGRAVDAGFRAARAHEILVDAHGRFRGIAIGRPQPAGGQHERAFATIAVETADRLAAEGYAGPFGIDAFVGQGNDAAQPLSDINARHTFGHVAHALRARVGPEVVGDDQGLMTLRLGDEPEDDSPGTIPLVGSADRARKYAWLVFGE